MAVSHVKSNIVADMTGTVTVYGSGGLSKTIGATDLVRPVDWNSVHNQYYTLSGNTTNASTASGTNVVFQASGALTISGATRTIVFSAGYATQSLYDNMPSRVGIVTGASAITQTSGSSIFVQPFQVPYPISGSWLRLQASFNDSAVGTAGTTSANTSCSVERYTTFGIVIYSQGVGASSRSIQSIISSSVGFTGQTVYTAAAQGSQYTVSLKKTYPVTGGTSSYSTSYAVSSGSMVISSNSNTLFTGPRFLDIPFATVLTPGYYWLGLGASTSSASNSSIISFAGTAALPVSIAGVSNTNVSIGLLGAATSASDHQLYPALGVWTTNASAWSTASIGMASVSQVVSNPQIPFQIIRSA